MKQPKIKIFDDVFKVTLIEFDSTGAIGKIEYQVSENVYRVVFKGDTMVTQNLLGDYKIQKPTKHPLNSYAIAPNLESLLC